MSRPLVGLAFAFACLASGGQAQPPDFGRPPGFPPGVRGPNGPGAPGGNAPGFGVPAGGADTNAGTCSSCRRDIQWSGGSANAPKKCPHCGVAIGYVNNGDGTRTNLKSGRTFESAPAWLGVLLGLVVLVVIGVVVVVVLVKVVQSANSKPRRKRKPPRRRPIEDDEDDAPPRKAVGRERSGPAADDGFEVVEEAPASPPRRATAKLLPPGDPR